MKDDRFWKMVALTALGLLAVAVFRGAPQERGHSGGLLISPAHGNVMVDGQYAYTTSQDGRTLYMWDLATGRDPVVTHQGRVD